MSQTSVTTPAKRSGGLQSLVLSPEQGDVLNTVGDVVRILAGSEQTAGSLAFFEVRTAPGAGPPLHIHAEEDEFFFVIEGLVKFSIEGKIHVCKPGSFIIAPRGSLHTFVNAGSTTLRMLVTVSPARIDAAFRENAAMMARNPSAGIPEITEIFGRSGITFHGPPLDPAV